MSIPFTPFNISNPKTDDLIDSTPFSIDLQLNENALTPYPTPSFVSQQLSYATPIPSFNPSMMMDLISFESFVIETINHDASLSLPSKLTFTHFLISNGIFLSKLSLDFYEEECHLSLLNWIWNIRNIFKTTILNKPSNDLSNTSFYYENKVVCIILELLNNILIIFELLDIKSKDILDLKLYEKLNKIKGYVRKLPSSPISNCVTDNINLILLKWKKCVDDAFEKELKVKKKKVMYDDTKENVVSAVSVSIYRSPSVNTDIDTDDDSNCWRDKHKKKRVVFNLIKNKVITFNKEEKTVNVGYLKNEYDPLIFN